MTTLDVVAVTHRGAVRTHNEDTVAVAGFLSGAAEGEPVRFRVDTRRPLVCLVADGLGGHAEGARASRRVAGFLSETWVRAADPDSVRRAVVAANELLYEDMRADPARLAGMGTTLVGLVLAAGQAIVVNVGDSRCHRLTADGMPIQVSVDDSPAGAGSTTVVTQTLGGGDELVDVEPHLYTGPTAPGDRFLLSSDGLTDHVKPDRIEECLAAPDPVAELLAAALAAGAPDNVSLVLATVLA